MKIRGTDFIMHRVSNLGRAVEFYHGVLGLPPEFRSDQYQWAEFDCGDLTLALLGGQPHSASGAGARIALAVDNVDAAFAELTAKGARVGPLQDFGVCRAFEVFDPDGNPLLLHRRADGTFGRNTSA